MNAKPVKTVVLALDGLDPELFIRWRNNLPNLSALANEGIFYRIKSTIPSMTFPAWSTFLTGVNSGRHGIFDFTERLEGRLRVRFINSTRRRYPGFLRLASDQGLCVGSVGLPTTYPPEKLTGFQISGFDTPLPSKADRSYVHPPELAEKIEREIGGYYFGNFNESRIGRNWHSKVLAQLMEGIERKTRLVHLLLREYPLDLLLLHVGETDTVGHHFWSFYDENSPRYVPTRDHALKRAIQRVYEKTDDLVGEVLSLTQPENVIVVSDHGMGGTSDRMLYLNRFLAENGLLSFQEEDPRARIIGALKRAGMKWMPYRWQQQVFRLAKGEFAASIESLQRFSGIDWGKTLAYSEELNYFPSVYLNLKGREPRGIVDPGDADRVISELSNTLSGWKDPESGTNIVRKVHRREDLYDGPETIHAPDLILELNDCSGYSYALGRSTTPLGRNSWRKMSSLEYIGKKGGSMNGAHRAWGTMILKANNKTAAKKENVSLLDMAPTILHLSGIQIPDWIEGRNLFSDGKLTSAVQFVPVNEKPYSASEEEAIRKKLAQLGYLQ